MWGTLTRIHVGCDTASPTAKIFGISICLKMKQANTNAMTDEPSRVLLIYELVFIYLKSSQKVIGIPTPAGLKGTINSGMNSLLLFYLWSVDLVLVVPAIDALGGEPAMPACLTVLNRFHIGLPTWYLVFLLSCTSPRLRESRAHCVRSSRSEELMPSLWQRVCSIFRFIYCHTNQWITSHSKLF